MHTSNAPAKPAGQPAHTPAPPAQAFLERLPAAHRGHLADLFHNAVRAGHADPPRVLAAVLADAGQRLADPQIDGERRAALQALLIAIGQEEAGAEEYAAQVIEWRRLPADERARLKAQRAAEHAREQMAASPPTAKQLAFLANLGHTGAPPGNRADASRLIDALKSQRGKAPSPFAMEVRSRANLGGGQGA